MIGAKHLSSLLLTSSVDENNKETQFKNVYTVSMDMSAGIKRKDLHITKAVFS